ncbi:cupin domain-containing protein [Xenorhabdus kozodoii]|uniref:Cupin n=1 Tax=Xenorhabdus kozodoii TaxID=351676 RepID=A0A2D0L2S4_9GAMM|nr:cupin domain-containing protein [Xenorhabdus kozodoii]PHM70006.1 cupin [Xenorhabdus kozodoii]
MKNAVHHEKDTLPSENQTALHLRTGEGKAVWMNGDLYTQLIDTEETCGRVSILEATIPPGGGPPRHNHENEDEIFYVTYGSLEISAGEQTFTATAGSLVFVPQGMMHGFRNTTRDFAKQLLIFTPGGFERFFFEVGLTAQAGRPIPEVSNTNQEFARVIGAKYGSYQEVKI